MERLHSATAARDEVVRGHEEALLAEEDRRREHKALVHSWRSP